MFKEKKISKMRDIIRKAMHGNDTIMGVPITIRDEQTQFLIRTINGIRMVTPFTVKGRFQYDDDVERILECDEVLICLNSLYYIAEANKIDREAFTTTVINGIIQSLTAGYKPLCKIRAEYVAV